MTLTLQAIDAIAAAAVARWTQALGHGDPRLAALAGVRVSVEGLPERRGIPGPGR